MTTDADAPELGPVRRPTLVQVAELAGVSVKTASRVINGERYVADETRIRVQEVADRVGFRLNPAATLLKRGVVPDFVAFITGDLANPFYSLIAKGVECEVRRRGLQLILASSDEDAEAEAELLQQFAVSRVRGILLTSTQESHAHLASVQNRGIPIVFVDRPPVDLTADAFVLDNYGGARAAIDELVAAGHRRIAYVGDYSRLGSQRERMRAYTDAMQAAGIQDWSPFVRKDAHDADSAGRLASELLQGPERPTAVFASNNRIAAGVLHALRECASRAALIGFDDFDLADLLGVTTVSYDPAKLGVQATRKLLDRGGSRAVTDPVHWVLPTQLVRRGSGERAPWGEIDLDPTSGCS